LLFMNQTNRRGGTGPESQRKNSPEEAVGDRK
jgi:hypothetical protein